MAEIVANGVNLPSPTDISIADELIWSSSTGRTASGLMIGDLIANKQTINIKWAYLTHTEKELIKRNLVGGFFSINILGESLTVYRGTIQSEVQGYLSGTLYYKSVSVQVIQQ